MFAVSFELRFPSLDAFREMSQPTVAVNPARFCSFGEQFLGFVEG